MFHPNSLIWGILPRKCFNVLAPVHFAYILGTLYRAWVSKCFRLRYYYYILIWNNKPLAKILLFVCLIYMWPSDIISCSGFWILVAPNFDLKIFPYSYQSFGKDNMLCRSESFRAQRNSIFQVYLFQETLFGRK